MSNYFNEQKSATLEFKEKIPSNDQLIKVVIGFCNQFYHSERGYYPGHVPSNSWQEA